MGIPSYVVSSEGELGHAVQHARGHDLILIDTAGRSPRSLRDPISLRGIPGVETHLVVPVGLSSSQLANVRLRHRDDDVVAMICTKLDETEGLQEVAALMNVAATLGLPLAATADGQGVPDDVTAFDSAALWRRLGGTR
jgi:flagellar biosynthesis protein FlhF